MIRGIAKYNSDIVLYVYPYFVKETQWYIACLGSGLILHILCLLYQLLIELKKILTRLRLLTRPSLLTRTQDTIHFSYTPNRVNILNYILIYSESSCGFNPHQDFPLAKVSLVNKIWWHELSLCMVIYTV